MRVSLKFGGIEGSRIRREGEDVEPEHIDLQATSLNMINV